MIRTTFEDVCFRGVPFSVLETTAKELISLFKRKNSVSRSPKYKRCFGATTSRAMSRWGRHCRRIAFPNISRCLNASAKRSRWQSGCCETC